MVNVNKTTLGCLLFKPDIFIDNRCSFVESYNKKIYDFMIKEHLGKHLEFVQDDFSLGKKNVLKGIHGDRNTWKLISCPYGELYLAVVNPQTKNWESFPLNHKNSHQVLIPAGFGNGHLILSDKAVFHYKQTRYYDNPQQFTIKWNDSDYNILWPIDNPILSKRDSTSNKR